MTALALESWPGAPAEFAAFVCAETGSASGIGAATAILLAQRGWNVTVNYSQNADGAAVTARACEAEGVETLVCGADVGEDADCRRLASETLARWGRIDALVNSAGTTKFVSHADLEGLSGEDFLRVYRVNVVGPYQMARAVAPGRARSSTSLRSRASKAPAARWPTRLRRRRSTC